MIEIRARTRDRRNEPRVQTTKPCHCTGWTHETVLILQNLQRARKSTGFTLDSILYFACICSNKLAQMQGSTGETPIWACRLYCQPGRGGGLTPLVTEVAVRQPRTYVPTCKFALSTFTLAVMAWWHCTATRTLHEKTGFSNESQVTSKPELCTRKRAFWTSHKWQVHRSECMPSKCLCHLVTSQASGQSSSSLRSLLQKRCTSIKTNLTLSSVLCPPWRAWLVHSPALKSQFDQIFNLRCDFGQFLMSCSECRNWNFLRWSYC